MKSPRPNRAGQPESAAPLAWFLLSGIVLVLLIAVLWPKPKPSALEADSNVSGNQAASGSSTARSSFDSRGSSTFRHREVSTAESPEAIVATKVRQFGQSRRAIAERIAHRLGKKLPPEIAAFFDAIEKGDWGEIESRWKELATHTHQYDYSKNDRPDLKPFWATVLDAYGAAEQAHNWPAQQLLDYGNAVLNSLRPDMVYVGGTDVGRWVPSLLNETSGGTPHIMLTQNALADGTYLEYVRELYGERFNTLSNEDSEHAFQNYMADVQKRLAHDQQFPDEPKQIRPGENVQIIDGRVQVSGQVAVMAINEHILQMLMQKNPDLSFAMQESFPLRGTYGDAVPLGPLMELGVKDAPTTFTAERATHSVDYWRNAAQLVLADPQATSSETTLKAYSHDINSTANLLAAHGFSSDAEQAYRLSTQLWPSNPEAVGGLANVLAQTGRHSEAHQLLANFTRDYPDQRDALEKMSATFTWTASTTKPPP